MIAYKGFNKDMTCMGFQYEEGKTYVTTGAKLCEKGFHACTDPLDCLKYYAPSESVYHIVDVDDMCDGDNAGDSKICGNQITIRRAISLSEMTQIHCKIHKKKAATNTGEHSAATNTGDWSGATNTGNWSAATNTGEQSAATNTGDWSGVTNTGNWSVATNTGDWSGATNTGYQSTATNTGNWSAATNTGEHSAAINTGDWSAATNTGNWSVATNTGEQSAATNTGDWSGATNTGNWSVATNTGDRGTAEVSGESAVAITTGNESKVRGALGCGICCVERDKQRKILAICAGIVDGVSLMPDVWYTVRDGKFVEVKA